ncbi:MAG: Ig-like domain-containing protein [Clostridia bacterium]|nr:Ig-like domain-containing protein [Clostridia bacterium]
MKRIKSWLLAIIMMLAVFTVTACKKPENPPTSSSATITLNFQTADIVVGGRLTLKATVTDAVSDVVWSTSDEEIATVDEGIVYGVDSGTAIITAMVGEAKASCTVTVVAQESGGMEAIPVLHFELSAERIWVGYSFEPSATLKIKNMPVTADITFASSNTSVAKIENGQIVALSVGETTITASCTYQGSLYQKTVTLVVVNEPTA